jgi:hypothetical protein
VCLAGTRWHHNQCISPVSREGRIERVVCLLLVREKLIGRFGFTDQVADVGSGFLMSNGALHREVGPVGFAEFPRQNPSQVAGLVPVGNPGNSSTPGTGRRSQLKFEQSHRAFHYRCVCLPKPLLSEHIDDNTLKRFVAAPRVTAERFRGPVLQILG